MGALLGPLCQPGVAVEFGAGPVLMIADEVVYDQATAVVVAKGDVEISRGGARLLADRVRYDQRADRMRAEGDVFLLEREGEMFYADEVVLTGDLRDGVIQQLRVRLQDDSLFAASQARRIAGTTVEMDRAVYSPCEICPEDTTPPLWQITASRVTHDQEERTISYRNAFLEMFGVPVAYTPYLSHPDPTVERKSGFLAPSIGNDSELGFIVETPYYWALAPNYDVTLTPILTSEENAALVTEYRHLLPNGRFELLGSGTYASKAEPRLDEPETGQEFRGHLEGEGRFGVGDGWVTGYDILFASDDTYLDRYDFSNESILNNRAFVERAWERNFVSLSGYGFQGVRPADEQDLIPVALPVADVALVSDPWRFGSRFTLDSNLAVLTRTGGLDTHRLSATGGYELPALGPIGDRYELRLSLRGDLYHTDGDPLTFEDDGTSTEGRIFPRATLDWSWPLVGDTFGWTSVIEPVVSTSVTMTGINDDDIPNEDSIDLEFDDTNLFEADRFPGLDRVDDGGKVSYGLRYGVFGDSGERLSLLFGQSYRFYGESIFDPDSGLDQNLSDYVGRIDVSPHPWFDARYRFRLDRGGGALERNEVRTWFGPPRVRFSVAYLSLDDDPAADEFEQREEIAAGVALGVTPQISLRARTVRNLAEDEPIAKTFGLVYRNPCLLVVAGAERRYTRNRDADEGFEFMVRLTFKNIGELGTEASGFGL